MYCQIVMVNKLIDELKPHIKPISWDKTYHFRIRKFFDEYMDLQNNRDRSLISISESEVNQFISSIDGTNNEKMNYYYALKKFFDYAAKVGVALPFFLKVKKYKIVKSDIQYISTSDVRKIANYIKGNDRLENRLLMALFLFTGLSRRYIAYLSFQKISDDLTLFRFSNGDDEVPIKTEITKLLWELKNTGTKKYSERFFNIDESSISTRVKSISKSICGQGYSPTVFSNTFIIRALGDDKWSNLYPVSKMTLESLSTILKHFDLQPSYLTSLQRIILEKWK